MSRGLLAVCAVAATLGSALGLSQAAPASAHRAIPVPQGFVGMDVDQPTWPDPYVDLGQQLDVMVASGVETLRVVFDWAHAQPYKSWTQVPAVEQPRFVDVGGIPTDFSSLDQLVGLASQRGLTVLPVILNAPSWDGQSFKSGTVAIPRSPAPYAAFAKALVRRYGPRGTFWLTYPYSPSVPIRMWQIWNEPNIIAFWPPQPYYSRYVKLLRAAHRAIRSADPAAKVVLAGLPNFSWLELARIYKFRGARSLFDVVAVHPYTRTPRGVITILGYVRKAMNQAGDRTKPILADEISWPSSQGKTQHTTGFDIATTESGQARNLRKLLPMLVSDRARLGLAGFYYYDWAGQEHPNTLAFEFAGLFRFSGAAFVAKPAYDVFRRAALAMEGCRTKGPLAQDCHR